MNLATPADRVDHSPTKDKKRQRLERLSSAFDAGEVFSHLGLGFVDFDDELGIRLRVGEQIESKSRKRLVGLSEFDLEQAEGILILQHLDVPRELTKQPLRLIEKFGFKANRVEEFHDRHDRRMKFLDALFCSV